MPLCKDPTWTCVYVESPSQLKSPCVMLYFQWVTALSQTRLLTARWAVEMSTTCTDAAVSHATMARHSCVQCPSSSPVARWVCGTQTAQWTHSTSHRVGVSVQMWHPSTYLSGPLTFSWIRDSSESTAVVIYIRHVGQILTLPSVTLHPLFCSTWYFLLQFPPTLDVQYCFGSGISLPSLVVSLFYDILWTLAWIPGQQGTLLADNKHVQNTRVWFRGEYALSILQPVCHEHHQDVLWKTHFFRSLVILRTIKWFDLIWFDWFDLIWFDLIWFDLIWFDLIWFDLIWLDLTWLDLTWLDLTWLYFTLLYFTLLYFTLLYFTLLFYYFILFYFILFYFILFYFILFYFILFYFILFYFIIASIKGGEF